MSEYKEKDVEKIIQEDGIDEPVVMLDGFNNAFIGVTVSENNIRAVYDYDMMVNCLMEKDGMTDDEAVDYISYNTIRAIPYMEQNSPIVFRRIPE